MGKIKPNIPKEHEEHAIRLYDKVKKLDLTSEQYEQVAQAYEKHIFGNASIENPDKKADFESFYKEIGPLCDFDENDIDFLMNPNYDPHSTAFGVVRDILKKGAPEAEKRITGKEYVLNYGPYYKEKNSTSEKS